MARNNFKVPDLKKSDTEQSLTAELEAATGFEAKQIAARRLRAYREQSRLAEGR